VYPGAKIEQEEPAVSERVKPTSTKPDTARRADAESLGKLLAATEDAVALLDANLHLLDLNDAFARLLSRTRAELRGHSLPEAVASVAPGSLLADAQGVLARVVAGGAPARVEAVFQPAGAAAGGDEGRRDVEFSLTPIVGGERRRLLLIGRDITAQRTTERGRASFLAMLSHELRDPLQTLVGYLDLALEGAGGELNLEQRHLVARAQASAQRLAAAVDDLLLLLRHDAGQLAVRRDRVDLAPVMIEAAEEAEALAAEASVRLETSVPQQLPAVFADATRIGQALRNLLTNAIKFTPSGGTVTLSAESDESSVLLRVRDTGIGIAPEHQARIFERFYQVPVRQSAHARSRRAPGQGLGLAIVLLLVESHGGTVELQSALGSGSLFTVRLPRAEE
jgi:PAS domain S-box-containing protein